MLMPLGLEVPLTGYLWWLLVPVIAAAFAIHAHVRARRAMGIWLHESQRSRQLKGNRTQAGAWRLVWGGLGLVCLAIALLGPIHGSSLLPVQRKGIDIVVCLDTSRSMLAQDVGENRLEEAKNELASLMEVLQGDRMSLVAFSGDVRKVAPLTRDMKTLNWFMNGLGPEDNRLGGTDLGGAIEVALEMFDGRSGSHEAIVLVTDGEDLSGEGLRVAELAAERGIRIYVLGMGTEGGAKVPALGGGWVQDETGEDVISRLEPKTLDGIAESTGGLYIPAYGTVLPLEQLYTRGFSRLEGRRYELGFEEVPSDRYQWPLLLGLIFLALEWLVSGRTRIRNEGAEAPFREAA